MLKFYNFYLLNVSWKSNCLARVIINVILSVIWMFYKDVLLKVHWYFIFKKINSETILKGFLF